MSRALPVQEIQPRRIADAVAPLSGNARYLDFVHSGTGGKPRHKRLLGFRGVFGTLTQTDDMRKSQLASRHNQKTASRPAVADLASPTVADEATPGIALSEASATTTRGAVASGRSPHAHVNDLPAQSANAVALRSRSTPTNGQSPGYENFGRSAADRGGSSLWARSHVPLAQAPCPISPRTTACAPCARSRDVLSRVGAGARCPTRLKRSFTRCARPFCA